MLLFNKGDHDMNPNLKLRFFLSVQERTSAKSALKKFSE